jgi:hypothetical protein
MSHRGHRGGYASRTRNPKGHRNLHRDIGMISWSKNKKTEHCNTEDTEVKKYPVFYCYLFSTV